MKIGAGLGIVLLIIAANLDSPPTWLLVLGWLTVGSIVYMYLVDMSQNSPYKRALYYVAFLFIPYAGIWGSGLWRSLLALVSAPSTKHLMDLLTGKPFLALTVLYLACVCLSYRLQMRGKGFEEDNEDNPRWREGKIAFELGEKEFLEGHTQEALNYFDRAIERGFSRGRIFGLRGLCLQGLEGFELLAKDLGWDNAASYYESQLVMAGIYLKDPDEWLGRRLRKNLRRRTASDGFEPSPDDREH